MRNLPVSALAKIFLTFTALLCAPRLDQACHEGTFEQLLSNAEYVRQAYQAWAKQNKEKGKI